MDKKKLDGFKKKLLDEKGRLEADLNRLRAENYAASPGADGSGGDQNFEDHMGDAATDMFDRERDLSLEQNIVDLLAQIELALGRISDGRYGLCEKCEKPIADARLRAVPYAALCVEDKEKEETAR